MNNRPAKDKDPVFSLLAWVIALVILFFVTLVLTAKSCDAQPFKIRDHIAPAAAVFVAGCFEGSMDGLQFHYDKPNTWWNPDISWIRKYKNRDVSQGKTFAGKYMVWTTDGWHMMKFGRNLTMFAGFTLKVTTGTKKKWYWYVIEGVSYWGINRIGFNISYNLLK